MALRIRQALTRALSVFALSCVAYALIGGMSVRNAYATTKTADEAIAWARSQVGKTIESDGSAPGTSEYAQCVDFIKAYYSYLGASPASGNGAEYATNTLPSGWTRVKGGVPQKGDILVYDSNAGTYSPSDPKYNPAGHVAIYESDYVTYHQNVGGQYVTKQTYKYNGFNNPYWGYIRPDWADAVPPVDLGSSFYACITMKPGNRLSVSATNRWDQQRLAAPDDYDPKQIYRFTKQSDGSYLIDSAYWNGTDGLSWYIQCDNAGTTGGTSVNMMSSTGSAAQRWYIQNSGTGSYYNLRAGHCSLVMRGKDGGSSVGTWIDIYAPVSGAADQLFTIDKVSAPSKPDRPSASSYTGSTLVPIEQETTLSWSESAPENNYDKRSYTLTIKDESGAVVLQKAGLTDTSYAYTFATGGTYTVQVRATNDYYADYYTDGEPATITVTAEKDEEKPQVKGVTVVSQTDTKVVLEATLADNVAVREARMVTYSGYGACGSDGKGVWTGSVRGSVSSPDANMQWVSTTDPADTRVRFSIDLSDEGEDGQRWFVAGDKQLLYFSCKDAFGNTSDGFYEYVLEFPASLHITMNIGDTLTMRELVGGKLPSVGSAQTIGYALIRPANEVLSFDGTYDESGRAKLPDSGSVETVFTATKAGTGTYLFIYEPTAHCVSAVVTVAGQQSPDDPPVEKKDQVLSGTRSYTVTEGDAAFSLDAKLAEGDGTLSYASSDAAVAAVDAAGRVTIGKAGTATIVVTAAATDAYQAATMEVAVTVKAKQENPPTPPATDVKVTSIVLDSDALELGVGESDTLVATVLPKNATDQSLIWTSTNKKIASVSSDGVVAGVKAGTATIKAMAADGSGVTATCEVTVAQPSTPTGTPIANAGLHLSQTSYTYTGAYLKPAVMSDKATSADYTVTYANNKNIGIATVTVTGKGNYTGTKKLTFVINPAKATMKKVKAGSKKATVTIKAQKGGVSYQLAYRTGTGKWKYVKTSKASVVVKKLKAKKKYTFRVRAYKKVGSATYYGAWSKTKKVKIKK